MISHRIRHDEGDDVRRRHDGAPSERRWRPALLGSLATVLAAAATAALAAATVSTWPGAGIVRLDTAVESASLALASLVAGYACWVLAAATLRVAPTRAAEGVGEAPERATGGVRVVSAALISVAGTLSSPILASAAEPPPGACVPVSPAAEAGDVEHWLEAGPGAASSGPTTVADGADDAGPAVPMPGWTPSPAAPAARAAGDARLVGSHTHASEQVPDRVVVHRGDTLWDIAARHLGSDATSSDVAQEWPRWYAANRDLIGPDPDYILPGQELVVPELQESRP